MNDFNGQWNDIGTESVIPLVIEIIHSTDDREIMLIVDNITLYRVEWTCVHFCLNVMMNSVMYVYDRRQISFIVKKRRESSSDWNKVKSQWRRKGHQQNKCTAIVLKIFRVVFMNFEPISGITTEQENLSLLICVRKIYSLVRLAIDIRRYYIQSNEYQYHVKNYSILDYFIV